MHTHIEHHTKRPGAKRAQKKKKPSTTSGLNLPLNQWSIHLLYQHALSSLSSRKSTWAYTLAEPVSEAFKLRAFDWLQNII